MNALNPVRRIVDQIVEPMLVHGTEATSTLPCNEPSSSSQR